MNLLTAADVAKKIHVGRTTVYEWAACGMIPCVRLNGVLRFDESDVEAWIAASKNNGRKKSLASRIAGKVIEAAAGGVVTGAFKGISGGKI